MVKLANRFHFWKVFWIVLAIYTLLALIGVIAIALAPSHEEYNLAMLLTWPRIARQCASVLFAAGFYYVMLNLYYRLIIDKKPAVDYIKYSLMTIPVFIVYLVGGFYLEAMDQKKDMPTGIVIFSSAMAVIFYIGLAMLIAYFTYLRDEKKQRKILEAQKMQLEVEKSQANFNFLKAQINPHFLHNTLNFLYSKSIPYSSELSEGILTLSDIMRYALSEGNAKDGKSQLKDEIEHVRNVIKIQQLRFSNNLNVDFTVEGLIGDARIIPFVLITLVENAFKHGDLKDTQYPIVIKTRIDGQGLYFYCRNKKKTGLKELSTGIGLENIRKRLDLAYGKDYSFNVVDEAEFYTTELTIRKL